MHGEIRFILYLWLCNIYWSIWSILTVLTILTKIFLFLLNFRSVLTKLSILTTDSLSMQNKGVVFDFFPE